MSDRLLTEEEIGQYRRLGYVVVPELIAADTLAEIDDAIQKLTTAALGQEDYSDILELEPGDGPPIARRVYNPFEQHEAFERLGRAEQILDRVEQLVGPDLQVQHSKLNMKPAAVGSAVEWHQDLTYFPHTNDDLLAALVYLDDATEENGCLQILPAQHTAFLDHTTDDGMFAGMITEDLSSHIPNAVALPAPAGSVIFIHCLTPHSSLPNRSPHPRRTMIFEYQAADAFPIYLGEMTALSEGLPVQVRGKPSTRVRFGNIEPVIPRLASRVRSLYDLQARHLTES
tara:strand:+ start:1461 stop:2318 length:858 start_codon:yes stop_codon:yes gene_type:complete